MSESVLERLAVWVKTAPGRRWFEQVDREAKARESEVSERRAMAQQIADARRAQKEELPELQAVLDEKDAVLKAAKAACDRARRARYEAATAKFSRDQALSLAIRRAEGRLRVTCDARLDAAQELLGDAYRDWDRIHGRLAQRVRAEDWMAVKSIITNTAELAALRQELIDADQAIERFKLVAEPSEEDVLAQVERAHAALAAVGWHVRRAVQS